MKRFFKTFNFILQFNTFLSQCDRKFQLLGQIRLLPFLNPFMKHHRFKQSKAGDKRPNYIHTHIYTHTCAYIYLCIYIYMHMCVCVFIYVCMHACMLICMYVGRQVGIYNLKHLAVNIVQQARQYKFLPPVGLKTKWLAQPSSHCKNIYNLGSFLWTILAF